MERTLCIAFSFLSNYPYFKRKICIRNTVSCDFLIYFSSKKSFYRNHIVCLATEIISHSYFVRLVRSYFYNERRAFWRKFYFLLSSTIYRVIINTFVWGRKGNFYRHFIGSCFTEQLFYFLKVRSSMVLDCYSLCFLTIISFLYVHNPLPFV